MLKRRMFLALMGVCIVTPARALGDMIKRVIPVSLGEAHKGTLEIDTMLLDSFGKPPENVRQFYFAARAVFADNADADFADPAIIDAAKQHDIKFMGGPMLGDLRADGVTIWLRPAVAGELTIEVIRQLDKQPIVKRTVKDAKPGVDIRVKIDGLTASTAHDYAIFAEGKQIASGTFNTAPKADDKNVFRLTFGTCFHKIGLHNPNLMREVLKRKPSAMMLYGDLAVDDRNNEINMHRADYQLRDVSPAWNMLAQNVPLYTSWDDHDYFDNDLSGIPKRFTAEDRDKVRAVWHQNWNNPPADDDRVGIYFNTRIGPVEVIMLDTRSCRDGDRRGEYGSYLGQEQFDWLKKTLRKSTAPFKVISSGTMWSDYISNGKDSWGTWDTQAREEIFTLIGKENIAGVLLVSGARHGARGFKIPRDTGYDLLEFEPATLGGVNGPPAMTKKDPSAQLFGYANTGLVAFGEFTFNTIQPTPTVTFRLISETGEMLEEHDFTLTALSS